MNQGRSRSIVSVQNSSCLLAALSITIEEFILLIYEMAPRPSISGKCSAQASVLLRIGTHETAFVAIERISECN